MASITSSNAAIAISIGSLYAAPQALSQVAADNIFGVDDIASAETAMGVDGYLTGGKVFAPIPWHIHFMPDSISIPVFEFWESSSRQIGDIIRANATVTLTSVGRKYAMVNGILQTISPMPSAGRTLGARMWTIMWGSVTSIPVTATQQ